VGLEGLLPSCDATLDVRELLLQVVTLLVSLAT
jgi:hypothetical protein